MVRPSVVVERYIVDKEVTGYQRLHSTNLAVELYKTSGHWITTVKTCSHHQWIWGWRRVCSSSMNCPHHIGSLQTPCAFLPWLPIRSWNWDDAPLWERFGALTDLQRVREMSLNDGHTFVAPEVNRGEGIQEDPSMIIDVYEDFNDQITVSACLIVILRLNTNTLLTTRCGKMLNMLKAAIDDMGWVWSWREAAFYGQIGYPNWKQLLVKETLSTINWTSYFQNALIFITLEQTGRTPSVMITVGVISNDGTLYCDLDWKLPRELSQPGLSPSALIPVSNRKHVGYAWEVAKTSWPWCSCRVDEQWKNAVQDTCFSNSKIPYQLIVGDRKWKAKAEACVVSGQKETETMSVVHCRIEFTPSQMCNNPAFQNNAKEKIEM